MRRTEPPNWPPGTTGEPTTTEIVLIILMAAVAIIGFVGAPIVVFIANQP